MSNPWNEIFDSLSEEDKLNNEALILSARFLEIVQDALEEQGLSRKDLAKRMGVSPSYLTQLFRGNRLLNMKAAVQMETALELKFHVSRKMEAAKWTDIEFPELAPKSPMPMKRPINQRISATHDDIEPYDFQKITDVA